jgi:hypothetical protein
LETKRAYLHLEKPKLQEVFLSTTNSVLIGKQNARCSCFWHKLFSLSNTCVSHTQPERPIWKKTSLYQPCLLRLAGRIPLKNYIYSQREDMLEVPASNVEVFLWKDTCVSSPQLDRPILKREPISFLKILTCRKISFKS